MRRTHLRGHANILKRLLIHGSGCNLGLWMRTLTGVGTPRSLQDRAAAGFAMLIRLWRLLTGAGTPSWRSDRDRDAGRLESTHDECDLAVA